MSTTALPAPNRPTGGVTPHGVEPSLLERRSGWLYVAVGLVVDLVAFKSALALVLTELEDVWVWVISAGVAVLALVLMFEAGRLEVVRREKTMGSHGKRHIRVLLGGWFALGVGATFIRLTAVPAFSGGVFDSASAGGSDPFGGSSGEAFGAASASGAIDLGWFSIYPEHAVTALFMLVLYLCVGAGVYLFGYRSYRPLLEDLTKKRDERNAAAERLEKSRTEQDKAVAAAAALRRTADEIAAHHAGIALLTDLQHALHGHQHALTERRKLADRRLGAEQSAARMATELAAISSLVATESLAAEATGLAAREHARTMLHEHLAEPSRTVMDRDGRPWPAMNSEV